MNVPQDACEHGWCQPSSECVLLTWMVRSKNARKAAGKLIRNSVDEGIIGESRNRPPILQNLKIDSPGDRP